MTVALARVDPVAELASKNEILEKKIKALKFELKEARQLKSELQAEKIRRRLAEERLLAVELTLSNALSRT